MCSFPYDKNIVDKSFVKVAFVFNEVVYIGFFKMAHKKVRVDNCAFSSHGDARELEVIRCIKNKIIECKY